MPHRTHEATVQDSLLVNTQSAAQGSVSTGPVKKLSVRSGSQTCSNIQGIQRVKSLRADLTFLVKILSDFTELPIAKKKKKSSLFYVFSLTVSVLVWLFVGVHVCMCVGMCFRACMGIGVIRKGRGGSVGHWLT